MTMIEKLPKETKQWPQWLERIVVSPQLVELVRELDPHYVVSRISKSDATLATICGADLPNVLQSGLGILSDRQITQLLDHPVALFELQEQAFEACSPYWDKLAAEVESKVTSVQPASLKKPGLAPFGLGGTHSDSKSQKRSYWSVMALAAGLLLAIGLWFGRPAPAPTGWGLAKINTLNADLKDSTYLQRLSELAAQWNNKQPADSAALVKRLREFRAGCQLLIEHPKPQLKLPDRDWLVAKCEKWAGDIDQLIDKLEAQQISFEDADKEAKGISTRMENVLRDKALELS